MKYFHAFLTLPSVARSMLSLEKGEVLFEQGENAESAFLLLEGKMRLTGEGDDWVYNEPLLGAGEVIGERALVQDGAYQRRFGCEAVSRCTVLEISKKTFLVWNRECPALLTEVVFFMVGGFLRRQDSANQLISALRPTDVLRRVIAVLAYWSRPQNEGSQFSTPNEFSLAMLFHYIDSDRKSLVDVLAHLASLGALEFKGKEIFVLKDRSMIINMISSFERKAA